MGSRGSVIPLFQKQRETGRITITDPRMTRFWVTLDQSVRFVVRCLEQMHGGEVFVPKLPSMRTVELAQVIAPDCAVDQIGIRPGEKLHEVLISEDEAHHTADMDDMFVIQPAHPWWASENWKDGNSLPDGFRYASDTNSQWLGVDELKALVGNLA
jgi:UDP-N-acetylglucosamine 4,6-dehydratase